MLYTNSISFILLKCSQGLSYIFVIGCLSYDSIRMPNECAVEILLNFLAFENNLRFKFTIIIAGSLIQGKNRIMSINIKTI